MNTQDKAFLDLFHGLEASQRETLIAFAEFLAQRKIASPVAVSAIEAPQPIERPREESVVRAIKRLGATYPMLDRKKLLHETSDLVTAHIMQGRDAQAVIDDIEGIFARHYEQYKTRLTAR